MAETTREALSVRSRGEVFRIAGSKRRFPRGFLTGLEKWEDNTLGNKMSDVHILSFLSRLRRRFFLCLLLFYIFRVLSIGLRVCGTRDPSRPRFRCDQSVATKFEEERACIFPTYFRVFPAFKGGLLLPMSLRVARVKCLVLAFHVNSASVSLFYAECQRGWVGARFCPCFHWDVSCSVTHLP